jgi:CDGSH-type Zn-finger protein/uncharacterized Fe-S cluster protein YjdI
MSGKEYTGKAIVIRYDAVRCIHARECVRGAPAVFDPGTKPWIAPDNAAAEHLIDVVARCPTGALSASTPDGKALEPAPIRNVASIQPRGPIYLRGRVMIPVGEDATPVEHTRVALCRCGASRNKPFCDNSHEKAGFGDAGVCTNVPASIAEEPTGELKLTPKPNGPLIIEGRLEFQTADGARFVTEKVWLCRCGGSANKPFCDGTHKRNGFTS